MLATVKLGVELYALISHLWRRYFRRSLEFLAVKSPFSPHSLSPQQSGKDTDISAYIVTISVQHEYFGGKIQIQKQLKATNIYALTWIGLLHKVSVLHYIHVNVFFFHKMKD